MSQGLGRTRAAERPWERGWQWCRTKMITLEALKGVGRGDKAWRVQHDKHGKFQYLFLVLVILQLVFFEEGT